MNRWDEILNSIYRIILFYFFLLVLFFSIRIGYLFSFGMPDDKHLYLQKFFKLLATSIRYDTTTILYTLLPLLVITLIPLIFPHSYLPKHRSFNQFFYIRYGTFSSLILIIISSLDFFFFKTYGHHFSSIIFGLKDDDTSAIMFSLWSDYPVLRLLLFWVIFFFFINKILVFFSKKTLEIPLSNLLKIIFVFLFLAGYFIGMRGSLASHGLDLRHASVTANHFVNSLTINPVFALKEAISEAKQNAINIDYKQTLIKNGFNSIEEATQTYLRKTLDDSLTVQKKLFKTTPKNLFLEQHPPNVVFILMESFSRHLFDLHSPDCNLLGDLAAELPYCTVFENALSSRNLTIHSLENILTGTPYTPIAQSPYNSIPLSTSIVNPFKKAQYRSYFIYGGLYGWRNIGNYLKTQGFDGIITQKDLEQNYPNASKFTWGLHDEYLYDKALELLQSENKPQFLFLLTLSNHAPFDIPKEYQVKPIYFPDSLYGKMRMDKDIVDKNLKAFQYANSKVGEFIHKIRTSKLGENTLIILTGDHNLHRGFKYNEEEMSLAHSVPIIFFIPDKYKPKTPFSTNQFGGHKDIFPTIFTLALSQASYFNTGQNLFMKTNKFSVNDFTFAANKYGAVKAGDSVRYYKWKDHTKTLLTNSPSNPYLDSLYQRIKAYKAVMGYHIQKELSQHK